jgi:hypothetical protein
VVTNPQAVEPEPSRNERVVRDVIAGHPEGAVRRIVLYLVLGVAALGGIALDGIVGLVFGGIALIALLLLAMTDQLA